MTFHLLDFVMYIVLSVLYWKIIPKDMIEEIGVDKPIAFFLLLIIGYIAMFAVGDLNWIDIFHNIKVNFKFSL